MRPHLSVNRVRISAWTKSAFWCGSVNHATSPKLYRSHYPHRSRELVSPVCGIFLKVIKLCTHEFIFLFLGFFSKLLKLLIPQKRPKRAKTYCVSSRKKHKQKAKYLYRRGSIIVSCSLLNYPGYTRSHLDKIEKGSL